MCYSILLQSDFGKDLIEYSQIAGFSEKEQEKNCSFHVRKINQLI